MSETRSLATRGGADGCIQRKNPCFPLHLDSSPSQWPRPGPPQEIPRGEARGVRRRYGNPTLATGRRLAMIRLRQRTSPGEAASPREVSGVGRSGPGMAKNFASAARFLLIPIDHTRPLAALPCGRNGVLEVVRRQIDPAPPRWRRMMIECPLDEPLPEGGGRPWSAPPDSEIFQRRNGEDPHRSGASSRTSSKHMPVSQRHPSRHEVCLHGMRPRHLRLSASSLFISITSFRLSAIPGIRDDLEKNAAADSINRTNTLDISDQPSKILVWPHA